MKASAFLRQVKQFPPGPQILPKLQQLLREEDCTIADVANLIKLDAALSAQVIKFSNSPYYRAPTSTFNIDDAVNRIGSQEVYKIVAIASTRGTFHESLPLYRMPQGHLWQVAAVCGNIMKLLAPNVQLNPDDAYTTGLLHALGCVIIQGQHRKKPISGYDSQHFPKGITAEKRTGTARL